MDGENTRWTDRNEEMGRKREKEMVGRETGWGGTEHSLRQGRERQHQGKAGQRETGKGSTPIMHFKTRHSDAMPRVGHLLAHMTGPQPKSCEGHACGPVFMETWMLCFWSPACEGSLAGGFCYLS